MKKPNKHNETTHVAMEPVNIAERASQLTQEPPRRYETTPTSPEAQEYIEWGPEINGYRFVAEPNRPQYYRQRHNLVQSDAKDTYEWSYLSLPDFVSNAEDYLDRKNTGEPNEDKESYYDQYFHRWEDIRRDGKGLIIFPVKGNSDLSINNIKDFIETSSNYPKALKIERIRWHPDKMARVLKIRDKEITEKITKCFQLINELWEQNKR